MADDATLEDADDVMRIEAQLRSLEPSDLELIGPPAELWADIERQLAAELPVEQTASPAPVISMIARRSRFRPVLFMAAAVAVFATVLGVLVAGHDTRETLATANLTFDAAKFDPLGKNSSAEVSLVKSNGNLTIKLDKDTLPSTQTANADLEMWLIRVDASGKIIDLVPIGLIDPAHHNPLAVPKGYDPTVYSVVDISIEPRDGIATHSGRSILRGTLTHK